MAQRLMSIKIGWLPVRFGWFKVAPMRSALAALLLVATATGADAAMLAANAAHWAATARILFAGGEWAAIDFGRQCEARSGALRAGAEPKPIAGFAFARGASWQGRFYVRLSRPARSGATVIATIGSEPFLLAGKGEWAWSRTAQQQRAMIDSARYGRAMRVESRDRSGRRFVDRYALAGAATAIDAAAAACAEAGKSQ